MSRISDSRSTDSEQLLVDQHRQPRRLHSNRGYRPFTTEGYYALVKRSGDNAKLAAR
jgi:hypothetical protein